MIATPQFVLGGIAAPDGDRVPRLTAPGADAATVCARVAGAELPGVTVACGDGGRLRVE